MEIALDGAFVIYVFLFLLAVMWLLLPFIVASSNKRLSIIIALLAAREGIIELDEKQISLIKNEVKKQNPALRLK